MYVRDYYKEYETYRDAATDAINREDYVKAKKYLLLTAEAAENLTRTAQEEASARYYREQAEKVRRLCRMLPGGEPSYVRSGNGPAAAPIGSGYQVAGNGGYTVPSDSYNEGGDDAPAFGDEDVARFVTFYKASELTGGFDSLVGLEEAKAAIREYVINPILYPDAYNYHFIDKKAILLEGPPGTGKTTFAKAVAKEIHQPFAVINVANLVDAYIGETGKNIDKVFSYLRSYADKQKSGITVFMDEFDEIAQARDGDDKKSQAAVPALLRNMDGILASSNLLILVNTNCYDTLDKAVQSRFRQRIHIPLPDKNSREKLFRMKLSDVEEQYVEKIDFSTVAEKSEGFSGRDIEYVCDDFKRALSGIKAKLRKEEDINGIMINIIDNRHK